MMTRLLKLGAGLALAAAVVGGATYWRNVREIAVQTAVAEQNVEVRVFGI
jgi:hypothetical protein